MVSDEKIRQIGEGSKEEEGFRLGRVDFSYIALVQNAFFVCLLLKGEGGISSFPHPEVLWL